MIAKEEGTKNMEKYEYLKANVYNKLKRKIISESFDAEFDMLNQTLRDRKSIKTFITREMHGSLFYKIINSDQYILIYPKKDNEVFGINDFYTNNNYSNTILMKNHIFLCKWIAYDESENHSLTIIRLIKQIPKDNDNNNSINTNNKNKKLTNINFGYFSLNINLRDDFDNPNLENYFDEIISLYSDLSDNSTMMIIELYSNLSTKELERYAELTTVFNQRFKIFIKKNLNIYLCNESIIINRSLNQIFNYVISCKAFLNDRFKIKDIVKGVDTIEIFIETKDKFVPNSKYQTKLCIQSLSDISCFVLVMHMIDIKVFDIQTRLLRLKTYTSYVVKLLKKKIENELILDSNNK